MQVEPRVMTETNAGLSELPQDGCLELEKRLNVAKSLLPAMREEATKFATQNSEASRLEKSKIRWIPIVLMALSY
jgi:hypothetical protein